MVAAAAAGGRRAGEVAFVGSVGAGRRWLSTTPAPRALFDRIIPEDDPALKKEKELEKQAVELRM